MRALGQVIPGSRYHLLDHDAWLNDQAIARLEALSALPRHRLATALPALRWGPPRWFPPLPEDSPALRCYRPCRPPGPPAGHARFRRHRRHGPDPAAGIPAALPPTPAMARRRRRNRADRYLRRPRDPHRAPPLPAAPGPQRRPGLGRRQHRRGVEHPPARHPPEATRSSPGPPGTATGSPGSATTSGAGTSAPGPSPPRSPKKASSGETATQPAVSRELANPEVRTCPVARPNET